MESSILLEQGSRCHISLVEGSCGASARPYPGGHLASCRATSKFPEPMPSIPTKPYHILSRTQPPTPTHPIPHSKTLSSTSLQTKSSLKTNLQHNPISPTRSLLSPHTLNHALRPLSLTRSTRAAACFDTPVSANRAGSVGLAVESCCHDCSFGGMDRSVCCVGA